MKLLVKKLIMLSLGVLGLTASKAQSFEELDADKDNRISSEEFIVGMGDGMAERLVPASNPEKIYQSEFESMDIDDNKGVTEDEWTARKGDLKNERVATMDFKSIDLNQDNHVSFEEYKEGLRKSGEEISGTDESHEQAEISVEVFGRWDADNDGFLDTKEFNRFEEYYLGN